MIKERGLFLAKHHPFAHAVTTQTHLSTSARLEQGGLIPSYLVQVDKVITSLRKASYDLRTKHVELATIIYFYLRQYITTYIISYITQCVLCKGLQIYNHNIPSRSS